MKLSIPMGVVSKNDVGERSTAVRAVLNKLKLAAKLRMLKKNISNDIRDKIAKTHAKLKLSKNMNKAEAAPKLA